MKKLGIILTSAILMATIASGCGGNKTDGNEQVIESLENKVKELESENASLQAAATITEDTETSEESKPQSSGNVLEFNDFTVEVKECEIVNIVDENVGYGLDENKFLVLTLNVENHSGESISPRFLMSTIIYQNGIEISRGGIYVGLEKYCDTIPSADSTINIQDGYSLEFYIADEAPEDMSDVTVEISSMIDFEDSQSVTLPITQVTN